jgi:hypothetical protein
MSQEDCGACGEVRDLAGGRSLAPLGTVYYTALLLAGAFFGASRVLFGGIHLAAAAHIALFILLVQRGVFCPPCVATGVAAIAAAGLSFVIDPTNLAKAAFLMPVGAIGAHLTLIWVGGMTTPLLASSRHVVPTSQAIRSQPPRTGAVQMIVFSRADCRYCVELEKKVLPELRREFGVRLEVSIEDAPSGIPTPTIVIGGAKGTVFPGLPPVEELKAALRRAIEGERHEPTMLSKP